MIDHIADGIQTLINGKMNFVVNGPEVVRHFPGGCQVGLLSRPARCSNIPAMSGTDTFTGPKDIASSMAAITATISTGMIILRCFLTILFPAVDSLNYYEDWNPVYSLPCTPLDEG